MLKVCVVMNQNYGGQGANYVNILADAVKKHLTVPHEFIAFVDDATGINCRTEPIEGEGWYAKLFLFKQFKTGERVIFFDLDTLIVDNINFLAKFKGKFAILRDFYRPKGYGSGVMMWEGGLFHNITDDYVKDGCPMMAGGDQMYIEKKVHKAKLLQEIYPNKIVSYKVHAMTGIPNKAAVICFHGHPKPSDFSYGWVKDMWK